MAYTADQLVALETALARGEVNVSYEGRSVSYRSIGELKSAISEVRKGLVRDGVITSAPRQVRVTTTKGFG